jgi:hypothetical protein
MSFGISAAGWAAIGSVASTGVAAYNGNQQNKAAKKAYDLAMANADKQEAQYDEALNAANMKTPDTASMLASAMLTGKGGASGTMLTGSGGVGKLGTQRKTLLGV